MRRRGPATNMPTRAREFVRRSSATARRRDGLGSGVERRRRGKSKDQREVATPKEERSACSAQELDASSGHSTRARRGLGVSVGTAPRLSPRRSMRLLRVGAREGGDTAAAGPRAEGTAAAPTTAATAHARPSCVERVAKRVTPTRLPPRPACRRRSTNHDAPAAVCSSAAVLLVCFAWRRLLATSLAARPPSAAHRRRPPGPRLGPLDLPL
eukprot:2924449-Pleurochrysis_carterae.AAC.1